MRITVLGAGSIVPTRLRHGSSILVESGGERLLMDVGPGSVEKLRNIGINPNSIPILLLTHFHVDHVSDLPAVIKLRAFDDLGYAAQPPHLLHIYGPRGLIEFLEKLIGVGGVYGYLSESLGCMRYLVLHEVWEGEVMGEPFRVSCAPVEHFGGVAYRVEDGEASLVYSGDTVPDERLIRLAEDADILIHECSFPEGKLLGKHTAENQLAEIAARIRPRILVVTHLYPVLEEKERELEERLREASGAKVIVARDMEVIQV